MKTIIALHGNPGTPHDWDGVKALLPAAEYRFLAVDAFSESDEWLTIARAGHSQQPVILLGHSWGAYRVLKAVRGLANVEKVVLVNPTLRVQKPLSGLASTLVRLPVLGDVLLKSSHAKSINEFTETMMAPHRLSESPVYGAAADRLRADWRLWKTAALNKIAQTANPLGAGDGSTVAGIALFGEQDRSSEVSFQAAALSLFPSITKQVIAGEGHGLPWSRPELIANAIRADVSSATSASPTTSPSNGGEKIGYYPGENSRNNVITYMEQHLAEHPDRVALRWVSRASLAAWDGNPNTRLKHDEINFRNFALRINSFAQGLIDIGVQKGDRVIIFLPMSLDMYTAMFAVQRIGAIAVFLDSWARSHHLGASAECVGPKAMISFKQAFDLVNQVPEFNDMPIRVIYGPGEGATHRFEELLKPSVPAAAAVESEFTALITFTTGSTGKPKGANRTHRFLSAQHHALNHVIPYTERDADMPAFPIFSLNNLAAGVTTVLPAVDLAQPSARDSAILAAQILHENVTCTTLSPSMLVGLARFCKEQGIVLKGLRRVVTGGAPISKDDVRAFYEIAPQTDLWILYGSTEAEPMAHIEGRDMLKESAAGDAEIVENGVNVGHISEDVDYRFIRIINGPVDLKVTDWDQIEVARGEVGEFLVTGDHVCREYYNNPEAFKTTKIMDHDGRVWHRTGDLAAIDADGNLWIVGRVNNAIERQGKYHFPVQAEVLLKRMPFANRCAFLGLADERLGQATWACVELKADIDAASFDFGTARAEIHRVFAKNKIPLDQIKFVKTIPMDPRHHSKVEYAVLRKQLLEQPDDVIA